MVGLRKPDPRIYLLACESLAIEPAEAVFLDDIGRNLKIARELGMTTIKVDQPDEALRRTLGSAGVSAPLVELQRAEGPLPFSRASSADWRTLASRSRYR